MTEAERSSDIFRTPDERFAHLPDFPYEPLYLELDGLRMARIDEGEGPPVLFVHGEPTWSFLWRHVIPPVRDAGFRCVSVDHAGFGRSDKPTDVAWYTYDRHVELLAALVEALDLRDTTIVVHDWGGPIGLRLAAEHPERIARMALMDTGLFTGHQRMSDNWLRFRDFVERTEDVPISLLVRRACKTDHGDEIAAAYDAPFPTPESKAGARAFPALIPLTPEAPGAAAGQRTLDALRGDTRPKLVLWADSDPVLPVETGRALARALGTELHHVVADAGHFLQEDQGPRIGALLADWLGATV